MLENVKHRRRIITMSEVYSLFEDVKDEALRNRNRGVIMANIYEDNLLNGNNVSMTGVKQVVSYYNRIPKDERLEAMDAFRNCMRERGYEVA